MRFKIVILFLSMFYAFVFANDLIIDKNGNEYICTIVKTDKSEVCFQIDSSNDSTICMAKSKIFMIKYADGRKEVNKSKKERVKQDTQIINSKVSLALQGQIGTFGLFNVDNVFTKAEITLGINPYVDIKLNKIFSLGAEYMLLFGKPETNDVARFIMNPNIRGKVSFPIQKRITVDIIVAGGVTIWPGSEDTAYIDSTFFDTRVGWDARAALGMDFIINPKISIVLDIGYIANSSVSDDIWITHDMMLVGLGPKIRF